MTTRTWGEFDDRAARIAAVLNAHGLGPGSKVGIYLHNSNEYSEAHHGIFKIRGCPINVNYRYKSDELVYLLDNADAEAVVFQSTYAMRIWEIREKLPSVKLWIQVDDGTESLLHGAIDFERSIRSATPAPRIDRAVGRRVHALHRRHDRHAERRDVPQRRLLPGSGNGGPRAAGFAAPTSVTELPESAFGSCKQMRTRCRSAWRRARRCTAPVCGSARCCRCCAAVRS